MDKLFDEVRNAFDQEEQSRLLSKIHEKFVDDALFVMVTHDVNPRAMSAKVKGFVQAQSWNQSLSPVYISDPER
jgi:ABC-type transport system substrate-binding protein